MKTLISKVLDGKMLFQVFVGIPFAVLVWYLWPDIAHYIDPGAPTFGLDVVEPMVIAMIYCMCAGPWAYIGAKLFDEHFQPTIAGCDTSFLLFCLFYLGYLAVAIALLA